MGIRLHAIEQFRARLTGLFLFAAALKNTVEGVTEAAITPLLNEVIAEVKNVTELVKTLPPSALEAAHGDVVGAVVVILNVSSRSTILDPIRPTDVLLFQKLFAIAGPVIVEAEKIPAVKVVIADLDVVLADLFSTLDVVLNGLLSYLASV